MPLKPLQPNSLNINQHIENIIKELGITDPNEQLTIKKEIGNQLMQLAMNQSSSWASLMLSPQTFAPALRTMVEKQHALYTHANQPAGTAFEYTPTHTQEMKQGIENLRKNTLELIDQLKKDPNLDTAFRQEYLPKLEMMANNLNPNAEQKDTLEATKELKLLLDLNMLLKHGSTNQLKTFVDNPNDPSVTQSFSNFVIGACKPTPGQEEKAREEKFDPEKLVPQDRKLIQQAYGKDPETGGYQQTPRVVESLIPITIFAIVDSIKDTKMMNQLETPHQPKGDADTKEAKSTITPFKTTPEPK